MVREIKDWSIMPIFAQRERTAVSVGEKAVLVPAGEDRGIGRGESRAGIEGQKEVVHELGRPRRIAAFLGQHLGEKKRAFHAARSAVAAQWTAGVELPVPEREYQNVGNPERASRAQQDRRRLAMLRNPLDQKNQ